MQGGEELSIQELASNLSTYKEQLQQVKMLLVDEPGNSEYMDMAKELEEVIALTEELLATAKQNDNSTLTGGTVASSSSVLQDSKDSSEYKAEQIGMLEQQEKFPVGMKVQAVWSEDGEWYDATIEAHTPNGYCVTYDGWGNKEEVDPANVRSIQGVVDALLEAERQAEATRQALKRKIAQAAAASDFQQLSLPPKLRINPDDPEDVKAAKRKKIHAFKSKVRIEQLEMTQNKRQNAWQQFQNTKGRAKKARGAKLLLLKWEKVGFLSGRKRESIFKSPDDPHGKVGVTGSGKGLTEFQKREKHLHLKEGNIESDE